MRLSTPPFLPPFPWPGTSWLRTSKSGDMNWRLSVAVTITYLYLSIKPLHRTSEWFQQHVRRWLRPLSPAIRATVRALPFWPRSTTRNGSASCTMDPATHRYKIWAWRPDTSSPSSDITGSPLPFWVVGPSISEADTVQLKTLTSPLPATWTT